MKSLKFFAAAALLAGALIQQAAATTPHIYVTGSSAFRSGAINAIAAAVNLPNTGTSGGNGFGGGTGNDTAYTNANPPVGQSTTGTENTSFIWEGGYLFNNGTDATGGTTPVTVCATFTGSQTGCCTCLGSQAIPFLPDGKTGTGNASCYLDAQGAFPNISTNSYVVGSNTFHGVYDPSVEHIPDMTFSDVFQLTTPFNGTLALGTPFNNPSVTFASGGNDNQVGFVTFKWCVSKNFPYGTITTTDEGTIFGSGYSVSSLSIEPNALNNLFTGGNIPVSQLTHNTADQHAVIFATGRNPDSGTRGTALADTGIGVLTALLQYQPTTITSGNITAMQLYPTETIAGLTTTAAGNSGEATGGTLRSYLADTLNPTGLYVGESGTITSAYLLTYLGTADAGHSGVKGVAVELSYKGVPFSANAIYQGAYTFWSIEHLLDRGDLTGAQALGEANIVSTLGSTASSALSQAGLSNLDVTNNVFQAQRFSDGGLISVTFQP